MRSLCADFEIIPIGFQHRPRLQCGEKFPVDFSVQGDQHMANNVPSYEKCFIISSASLDGGERDPSFEGEYALTEQNILSEWAQGL